MKQARQSTGLPIEVLQALVRGRIVRGDLGSETIDVAQLRRWIALYSRILSYVAQRDKLRIGYVSCAELVWLSENNMARLSARR